MDRRERRATLKSHQGLLEFSFKREKKKEWKKS